MPATLDVTPIISVIYKGAAVAVAIGVVVLIAERWVRKKEREKTAREAGQDYDRAQLYRNAQKERDKL
jgi:cytochrome c oxidase assembly factor CtaG